MAKKKIQPKNDELDGKEFFAALELIEKEKGISKAYMLEKITQALVSAIPEPSTAPRTQRILLEGDIPSVVNPPKGCRFCQRCFKARPECFEREPEFRRVGEDHYVRCHFAKEAE